MGEVENTEKVDDTIEEVFSEIPASVNQLIEELSHSGIEQKRCRELHHKMLSVSNVWHISGGTFRMGHSVDEQGLAVERLTERSGTTGIVCTVFVSALVLQSRKKKEWGRGIG